MEERVRGALAREPEADAERRREIENGVRADGRKAVDYYDLTFSPVKSVSVFWAALLSAGREAEAGRVVAAHRDAVAKAMAWAEREVAYTRVGYHGKTSQGRSVGRYEQATGLVWTRWDHWTNRAQEPQLHSHVAVLNRVVTAVDGKIRALDGRGFAAIKHGIDAIYVAAYERGLSEGLGVVFAARPDGKAREIMGVDQRLLAAASTRHAQVVDRVEQLEDQYVARHGHAPSPATRARLSRAAALATRAAKTGLAPGLQVARWCASRRMELARAVDDVGHRARLVAKRGHPDQRNHPDRGLRQVMGAAVARTQARYATWTVGNLIEAIDWELTATPAQLGATAVELAAQVVADPTGWGIAVLSTPDPGPVPVQLRRADGKSRYRPHHDERYATLGQLDSETTLVALARAPGAPALASGQTSMVALELDTAGLGRDQRDAVLHIVTSGRRGDVLIGPAGAGKSHTVGVLARVWGDQVGGRVFGLATSQIATMELADNGLTALNTTRFTHQFAPDSQGRVRARVEVGDLVVIDEVGMSSTAELATIARIVAEGGGKLLYIGDHAQLGSVEAGGLLNLLVADNGCVELTELHRFTHPWEAEASLGLRAGDTTVLDTYDIQGRLVGGSEEEAAGAAMRGWLADTLAGKHSLLVVGSNEQAARLSAQIRAELVRLGRVHEQPIAVGRDGNPIGVGDWIQARRNDPTITVGGTGMVTNRATYQVLAHDAGAGVVRVRSRDGLIAHMPVGYMRADTTLAYATTVHAAQGRTVETCHALIDTTTDRASTYVALSRGREANIAYVVCAREGDTHHHEPLATTPRAQMADILTRADAAGTAAAELTRRAALAEGRELGWIGSQFDDITTDVTAQQHSATLTSLLAGEVMATLAGEPGYRRLLRAIRAAELAGHNPTRLLTQIVAERSLAGAESMTDVLRWRIQHATRQRTPERAVTVGDWSTLTEPVDGPVGDYLQVLAAAATARQRELGYTAAHDKPAWALHHLGQPPSTDGLEREKWIRTAGIVAAYREIRALPTDTLSIGPAPAPEQVLHRTLWRHAHVALGPTSHELDYATASDAELEEMCEHYRRELSWAPYDVYTELREARLVATGYHQDAILWRAEAEQLPPNTPQRARADTDVTTAQQLAARYDARIEHLDAIATARARWHHDTQRARTRHRLARQELDRRGIPTAPAVELCEQAALFQINEHSEPDIPTQPATRLSASEQADHAIDTALTAAVDAELHDGHLSAIHTTGDQNALFALTPNPRDNTASEPLYHLARFEGGDQLHGMTLAQARRHA